MVHPGSREWRAALREAGIAANAPKDDVTTAVHALGLDWWFMTGKGHDILGRQFTHHVAQIWAGVGTPRPNPQSPDPMPPVWTGFSESSRDEALGLALRGYFSSLLDD